MNKLSLSHSHSFRVAIQQLLCILFFFTVSHPVFASLSTIADTIQNQIESNLYQLKPNVQSHYAIRMYRLTGRQKYLYPIIFNQLLASIHYQYLLQKINWNGSFPRDFKIDLPEYFKAMNKWEKRKYILKQIPDIKLKLQLVYLLSIASQLNMTESQLYPNAKNTIKYLKKESELLKNVLLNPLLIQYAPANTANHVYALRDMNILNMTNQYQAAFQNVFPDEKDALLSDAEWTEKIYGMTHIIIAGSNYYQHKLVREDFSWIYAYFDAHIDEIISRLKYDVVIEVGLCYLLADKITNQYPLAKIKNYILRRFDTNTKLITEPWDQGQIDKAEHRNILTILFLKWTGELHPGPDLFNSGQYKQIIDLQSPL